MKHHPTHVSQIIFELLRTSERNWLVQHDLDRFAKFSCSAVSPQTQYLQYSDMLLIWRKFENGAPDSLNTAEAMVDTVTYATSMTLGTFLGAGLPLRGAIGFGDTFINTDPLFFTGVDLYQTMKSETQQEWAGVCIDDSAKPYVDIDWPYVVEATIPLKNDDSTQGIAVNWVGPLKIMNITPPWENMFVSEDPSTILKGYNTRNFYDNQLNSNWGLPSIAQSTIDALREKVLGVSSQPNGSR